VRRPVLLSRYSPSWLDICALINIIGTSAHRLTADPLSRKIQLLYLTQLVADPRRENMICAFKAASLLLVVHYRAETIIFRVRSAVISTMGAHAC
jgi:hypothetical protein